MGVGVKVGVGVNVGAAVMVGATRASTVVSMSGVGVGVWVCSAVTGIACTVASKSGVGVGVGDWFPSPQAIVNSRVGTNIPKVFIAWILSQGCPSVDAR